MEHADVRELLEVAAAEPDGLERLAAGDTQESSAVAGHLAGCDECTRELIRLERMSAILRARLPRAVDEVPPADLRERTLAFVSEVGRQRSASAPSAAPTTVGLANADGAEGAGQTGLVAFPQFHGAGSGAIAGGGSTANRRSGWRLGGGFRLRPLVAMAAVLALVIGGTGLAVRSIDSGQAAQRDREIDALADVATSTLRVSAAADATHVQLSPPTGGVGSGVFLFSPSTRDVVVVMTGFVEPPAGREYGCWVETGGRRARIGRMFFGGSLGYWIGPSELVAGVGPGAKFGVTLVDAASGQSIGDPVLLGTLAS